MKLDMFIPKVIKVGLQHRKDTYTGKLSYIIYRDDKNKWRKENSWESWRDKSIEPIEFENIPTEGFVLNKKAGGYDTGWNHRQTYCRVYDPRGFEFEISIENLLYILENTNSIKGKGLEGEFVYAWSGKELVLLPTNSPDYNDIVRITEKLMNNEYIKIRDLEIGTTYRTKQGEELTYMGKFVYYDYAGFAETKPSFWFARKSSYSWDRNNIYFCQYKSLGKKLIDKIYDRHPEFDDMLEKLEKCINYSPIDEEVEEYVEYNKDEILSIFKATLQKREYLNYIPLWDGSDEIEVSKRHNYKDETYRYEVEYKRIKVKETKMVDDFWRGTYERTIERNKVIEYDTLEELVEKHKLSYRNRYLKNGKLYDGGKYEVK